MLAEDVIFDMVLATNPDRFLTWFFHDWGQSDHDKVIYKSIKYTIFLEYEEPNLAREGTAHEIHFFGHPYTTTYDTTLNSTKPVQKDMGFGFMTVLEIANERIHIQGFSPDYVEFDYHLKKIGEHISEIYSPTHKIIKGEKPAILEKPSKGDPDEKWIEYYHWCKWEGGVHYTFEDMAKDRHLSPDTLRKRHMGCALCSERRKERKRIIVNKKRNK